jgi:hypothetical protein
MKIAYVLTFLFLAFPQFASAAPDMYDGYCLILLESKKPGEAPPQGEVRLKIGESKELLTKNGLTYTVKYSNDLGREGVLSLFIINKTKNRYVGLSSVSIDQGTTFPGQVDLLSEHGGISCLNWTQNSVSN